MSRDRRPIPHGTEQARIRMNTGMFTYNPNRGCTLSIEDALSTFPSTVDTVRARDVYESIIKNRVPETRRIAGNSSEPRRQSSVRVKSIMEPLVRNVRSGERASCAASQTRVRYNRAYPVREKNGEIRLSRQTSIKRWICVHRRPKRCKRRR